MNLWRGRWPRLVARAIHAALAIGFACFAYTWLVLVDVRGLRSANPATTAFMELRAAEAARQGRRAQVTQRWVGLDRISPSLIRAVVVSEDSRFWEHEGIDVGEVRAALEATWSEGAPLRGASTITQQLAKNLHLSPSRNPIRKFVEVLIARRLEAELPKRRILELYLNVVEWGDGIWGAEAAARAHFDTSAAGVSREQAALLAGALINPRVYDPGHPNARLIARQRTILRRMGNGAATPP